MKSKIILKYNIINIFLKPHYQYKARVILIGIASKGLVDMFNKRIRGFFSLAIFFSCQVYVYAQANQHFKAPLFTNLGTFHHLITTKNKEAQRFFDQGLILFYGFEWGESIRSFQEAIRLDPNCAMCYWGLALGYNSKINAPINGHEYQDGKAAIDKAKTFKKLSQIEQDYIFALAKLFQHQLKHQIKEEQPFSCHPAHLDENQSTKAEMKQYREAMKELTLKYPQDNDAKALYAYALFNEIDWEFWNYKKEENSLTPELLSVLKSILQKNPRHIGGVHYSIHVLEQSPNPEAGLADANLLRNLVPGSEHLVHMPTHIYFLTGRYHEGSDTNQQAIEAFNHYNQSCKAQGFEPEVNYLYLHNYDFLRTTAIMEGRKALALSASDAIIQAPFSSWLKEDASLQWFIPIPYFVKARFGMWDEILKEPAPSAKFRYAFGMWHYARGMAYAYTDQIDKAKAQALMLSGILAEGETSANLGKQGHHLLDIANEILFAKISDLQNIERATINHLQKAAQIQYEMGYHEPPDWYFPVNEILADAYLKWGHPREAKLLYEKVLTEYPNNGWSLYGLSKALRAAGNDQAAEQTEKSFTKAWNYADIPTPYSLF